MASGQWSANPKSEIRNPKSLIPNLPPPRLPSPAPLFSVRTPTATVTDLGTEFGVEVSEQGSTTSHVFRGMVEVRPTTHSGTHAAEVVRLTENESLEVRKQPSDGAIRVRHVTTDSASFVRTEQFSRMVEAQRLRPIERWRAYSRLLRKDPDLVAYYTFEKHDGPTTVLPNQSAAGGTLDGRIEGGEWVYGRLPGKMALYFHGPENNDYVELPLPERFTAANALSVAVWFKVERFTAEWQTLIATGRLGWRLLRAENSSGLAFATLGNDQESTHDRMAGPTDVADGRWHLAVAVYEPAGSAARKRLYVDGRLDAEREVPLLPLPNDPPLWLGTQSGKQSRRGFWGWIDEVAIFARALSAEEVAAMFQADQFNTSFPARKRSQ